jgi:HTH-type transcriptional regulator/antitoxin HigA
MARASYAELLAQARPQVINDPQTHQRALRVVDSLIKKPRLTKPEGELLDLLVKLINDYEETIWPTRTVPPSRIVSHLIESRCTTQAELARQS